MRPLLAASAAALLALGGCSSARAPEPAARPRPPPPPAEPAEVTGLAVEAPAPPPPPPVDTRPRVWSVGYVTYIWPKPVKKGLFLGYVRYGTSVPLRSPEKVKGEGCAGGWVQTAPRGFVCLDRTATLEPTARQKEAFAAVAPDPGPFPYSWALSDHAPMYNRVPSKAEWTKAERGFLPAGKWQKIHKSAAAHEELAVRYVLDGKDPLPAFLDAGRPVTEERQGLVRQVIPLGSMLSFTKIFPRDERPFVLSADMSVVPADRVRWFKPSAFHGLALTGDATLPGAWARKDGAPLYERRDGRFEKLAERMDPKTFRSLSGTKVELDKKVYWELKAPDGKPRAWVREDEISLTEKYGKLPFLVEGAKEKWIQVRITKGTLVAYVGLDPVYTTLISPGKGGVPIKGRNPIDDATTPTGSWRVTWKDRANHMSPDNDPANRTFWIADVPWIQYFNAPFAIHGAFWHERFGEPTSAGCVNVSPIDGKWLYEWSDPQVPPDWGGAAGAGAPDNGPTTVVVVQK